MEVVLEGYLNSEHNPGLLEGKAKKVFIKVLDGEGVAKVKNVLKHWSQSEEKIYTPVYYAEEGGLLLGLNTQKLSNHYGVGMVNTPRSEWFNKKYRVRFSVNKYAFSDKGTGRKINGVHFILKNIEII